MNQYQVGRVPVESDAHRAVGNHVVPEMGNVFVAAIPEGFIMPELISHDNNDIFSLELAKRKISINEYHCQRQQE